MHPRLKKYICTQNIARIKITPTHRKRTHDHTPNACTLYPCSHKWVAQKLNKSTYKKSILSRLVTPHKVAARLETTIKYSTYKEKEQQQPQWPKIIPTIYDNDKTKNPTEKFIRNKHSKAQLFIPIRFISFNQSITNKIHLQIKIKMLSMNLLRL